MSEGLSRISTEQLAVKIQRQFFPKVFYIPIKEINILSKKELALSSLDYLDKIQLMDSTDYAESELSKAFDSSLD